MVSNEGFLLKLIGGKLEIPQSSIKLQAISGGSINNTYKVTTNNGTTFFAKTNLVSQFPDLLEKEKNGLDFLAKQKAIRIPAIIGYHKNLSYQLLILEWIEEGNKTASFWKMFGEKLAQLHKVTNPQSGFPEDNYMGALPQSNIFSGSWIDFFIHQRLQSQIQLAFGKGLLSKKHLFSFENLYKILRSIFEEEKTSLLHGDLWSGNFICDINNQPVLIDPAVYFGHRSMDMGMTTLFGGFDKTFYDAYNYHFPLPRNYREQWDICNLYPLLVHLNLFGGNYLPDIDVILKKFGV